MPSVKQQKKQKKTKKGYWNKPRREICAWLENNASTLAELYKGALSLLYSSAKTPGWQVYVCNSVREIGNRLPDAVQGEEATEKEAIGRFDYKGTVGKISKLWKANGFAVIEEASATAVESQEVQINKDLFEGIKNLIIEHEKIGEKKADKAKKLFRSYESTFGSSKVPIADKWIKITDWFSGKVHVNTFEKNALDKKKLLGQFLTFEDILGSIIRSFFSSVKELDEILEETNK